MTSQTAGAGSPTALHLLIRGRVQGVFFRASLRDAAIARGVSGWTRNRLDGSVEALLSGPAEAVDAVLSWVDRGPPGARVDSVERETAPVLEAAGFEIRPTV